MGKDAYYFFHDSNARNDPKILAMRSVYGAEGYGWYWMIIEIFRDDSVYKIAINKYTFPTLAMQLQCDCNTLEQFVNDCCTNFVDSHGSLLSKDDNFLWSAAFLKRMDLIDGKRHKNRKAANLRWGNEAKLFDLDADAMQPQSNRNPDARIIEYNIIEGSKEENNRIEDNAMHSNGKIEFKQCIFLKQEEYDKLVERFGREGTDSRLTKLSLYVLSKGVKYKSHYHTILSWEHSDEEKKQQSKPPKLIGHAGMKVE